MRTLNLTYARHNKGQPCLAMDHQRISYFDLTVVLRGSIKYVVDGESYLVEGGDAILIRPNSVRSRPVESGVDYISFNFRTDDEILFPTHLKGALGSEARLLIDVYDRTSEELYGASTEANAHLLACLISILEEKSKREELNPLTVRIISFINESFGSRITLSDVGALTFFSPIYCDTVFKRDTGRSIIDYLIERRIDEARKQLSGTALPLSEIAEGCGFTDYNYFCRVFKKLVGRTPREYSNSVSSKLDM